MSERKLVTTGKVVGIFLCPTAKGLHMTEVPGVEAVAGHGLKYGDTWDRYAVGQGSFNKKTGVGNRQVSLMNARFFKGTDFTFADSYRNIITDGVELLWLIGREFQIGNALFRGVKYLDPCATPSKRSGKAGFKETFFDCGAIIAEVLKSGAFRNMDDVFHDSKGY